MGAGRVVLPEETLEPENLCGRGHALGRFMTARTIGRVKLGGGLGSLQFSCAPAAPAMQTVTKPITTINALVRCIIKLTTSRNSGCGCPYRCHVQAELILWPIADLRSSLTHVRFLLALRTSLIAPHMSALGGKADISFWGANVCF